LAALKYIKKTPRAEARERRSKMANGQGQRQGGRGGKQQQPPKPIVISIQAELPRKEGDRWKVLTTATVNQGERALGGQNVQFYMAGMPQGAESPTDENGRVPYDFDLSLAPAGAKTVTLEAQLVGQRARGRTIVTLPEEKKRKGPFELIVDPAWVGNSVSHLARVVNEERDGIAGARLVFVKNGSHQVEPADEFGEKIFTTELQPDQETEITICVAGHGDTSYDERFRGEKEETIKGKKISRVTHIFLLTVWILAGFLLLNAIYQGGGEPRGVTALKEIAKPGPESEIVKFYSSSVQYFTTGSEKPLTPQPEKQTETWFWLKLWFGVQALAIALIPLFCWDDMIAAKRHAERRKKSRRVVIPLTRPETPAPIEPTTQPLPTPGPQPQRQKGGFWERTKERFIAAFSADVAWEFIEGLFRRLILRRLQ